MMSAFMRFLPATYSFLQKSYASIPKNIAGGKALPPLRLAFVITHRCNLKCAWCMVTDPRTKKTWDANNEINAEEIEATIRQTRRYCMITITGGEPFIRTDIVDILTRSSALRPTHLVTNGTMPDRSHIRFLVDHGARSVISPGMVTIGISVEGPESIHDGIVGIPGSYSKTMGFIESLISYRTTTRKRLPLIDVKVVLTRDNWKILPDLRRDIAALGADLMTVQIQNNQVSAYGIPMAAGESHLTIPPAVPPIDGPSLHDMLAELKRDGVRSPGRIRFTPPINTTAFVSHYHGALGTEHLDCHATWTTAHVGPYGDLFPCFSISMGNIRNASFNDIWNGPRYRAFRNALRKQGIFPGCIGCCMASPRTPKKRSEIR